MKAWKPGFVCVAGTLRASRPADHCPADGGLFWRRRTLLFAALISTLLAACGGGGGSTAVSSNPQAFNGPCTPGVVKGFTGGFNDTPVQVIPTGDGNGSGGGGDAGGSGVGGVGGDGGGAPGIGVGGALGQFTNVDVTVQFKSGQIFGPVRVDDQKGMVTFVPCNLQAPAMVTFSGVPGSGAQYYDEALGRNVSFEGRQLRTVVTAFDKNVGVTSFTEAMVRRTERLASDAAQPEASAWTDSQRVETAHTQVKAAVNDLLPGQLRLDDLRRLPVILNRGNLVSGSGVLTDTQNGRYAAVLAGFAQTGGANLGQVASPALEINRQFAMDMADGRIDLTDSGRSVIGTGPPAYTVNALWTNQTLQTTQTARLAGVGALSNSLVAFDSTLVVVQNPTDAYTLAANHFSDGTLRYDYASTNCPGRLLSYTFSKIRQKEVWGAISQDGLTYYSPILTSDPCVQQFTIPFNIPGARIAWLDSNGQIVRTTDGRFFAYISNVWVQFGFDGPRQIQIEVGFDFVWGVSSAGELYRHSTYGAAFVADPSTGGFTTSAGSAMKVALPAPVVLIAASDDRRELFALTTTRDVYWIDVRDLTGARASSFNPKAVKLDLGGPICWISGGLVAVSCDSSWFRTVMALTDANAPPVSTSTSSTGVTTIVPGVGGVSVSPQRKAVTPIWRSTSAYSIPPGTARLSAVPTFTGIASPAHLIGVDGSVRELDGTLITPVR